MCGILAVFGKNISEDELNRIKRGFDLLQPRGPDHSELKINDNNNYILGFQRLSIMDLSEHGYQPFMDIEGRVVVCNGEIYNHKELIKKYNLNNLQHTTSDCGILLELYTKIGFPRMIEELHGVFAIVLIDGKKIYLGRDRIGVRPLFTGKSRENGNFCVASEAKVLEPFCWDIHQFEYFWQMNIQGPETWYEEHRYPDLYWDEYSVRFKWEDIGEQSIKDVHNILTKAVEMRLMSDRPIGVLLSGGLDSSLITSILCKKLGAENVRTYSIGMKGSPDLHNAEIVAEYLGTKHTPIIFTPEEGLEAIPEVIRVLESYDITTVRASVGMYLLGKWIKENTEDTVIYSGEGADEIFCGYLYFHHAPNDMELGHESNRLVRRLRHYDVLRADRCISCSGLELRVPFLDLDLVSYCMNLSPDVRKPHDGMEKYVLRKAFDSGNYLPKNILWRRKDGFSDSISPCDKPWFKYIQEYVEDKIIDWDRESFPSKEAQYYYNVFKEYYKSYTPDLEYWMPKWIKHGGDPSGRLVSLN